jgi:hypothetical protein
MRFDDSSIRTERKGISTSDPSTPPAGCAQDIRNVGRNLATQDEKMVSYGGLPAYIKKTTSAGRRAVKFKHGSYSATPT